MQISFTFHESDPIQKVLLSFYFNKNWNPLELKSKSINPTCLCLTTEQNVNTNYISEILRFKSF
jgi:hypothetical protein